jgi:hypothetical protein
MSIWETTFDDAFWLTLSGAMFAFGGVCLQAILKSRCREFHCCGLGCVRDVAPVGFEPDLVRTWKNTNTNNTNNTINNNTANTSKNIISRIIKKNGKHIEACVYRLKETKSNRQKK